AVAASAPRPALALHRRARAMARQKFAPEGAFLPRSRPWYTSGPTKIRSKSCGRRRRPQMSKDAQSFSRRKFLKSGALAAGAAATATVAMPQVSRAQTVTWRYQSTWPTKDIFHEFAVDYAKKVNDMSGGRLKLDVLAAGAVVPASQVQDAVHSGVLDGGHGVTVYWYGKNKAASLFGTPPSMGWDSHSLLAWFYHGGGE